MVAIYDRSRYLSIPSGAPCLDRSHWACQPSGRMVFCAVSGPGIVYKNIVTGRPGNSTAGGLSAIRQGNPGTVWSFGSGNSNSLNWGTSEALTTSDGAGTGDYTLLIYAAPIKTGSTVLHTINQRNAGGALNQTLLCLDCDQNNAGSNGAIAGWEFAGTVRGAQSATTLLPASGSALWRVIAYTRRGTARTIYDRGFDVTSASSAGAAQDVTTSAQFSIGSANGVAGRSPNCQIALGLGFNRALSAAEIFDLSLAPFSILFRNSLLKQDAAPVPPAVASAVNWKNATFRSLLIR